MVQSKLPTIWNIKNHTLAKHEILKEYLKGWFPILSRYSDRIVFLDGFAGPGVYQGGEDGSPIIAIQTALENKQIREGAEIVFIFIEENKERSEVLQQTLKNKFPDLPSNIKHYVITGNFASSLNDQLDELELEGKNLDPTLAFIDPFGYSDCPIDLITRIMQYEKCEVFITFMSGFLNRFLDQQHEHAIDLLYGTKEWRKVREIHSTQRIEFLLSLFVDQLKFRAQTNFVRPFTMKDESGRTIYHLIFGTKHWKGMNVMKMSMLKVVDSGTYQFADKIDNKQTYLFNVEDDNWHAKCAEKIVQKFHGRTVAVEEIRDFVLADTPFRLWKSALKYIEKNNPKQFKEIHNRKRKSSFPDRCIIEFA